MTGRVFGQRVPRNEDPSLLTGRAQFIDDVEPPGTVHVAFYRSDFAHARIGAIDVSRAAAMPGVLGVYTADDLGDAWQPGPLLVSPPPIEGLIFNEATQVPLARGKVVHAGEPIVALVAESRYQAEDATAELSIEIEPLPAVVDMEAALDPDATLLHEHLGTNLAAHCVQSKGDWNAARAEADLIVGRRFVYDRGAAAAIENRGVVAVWDERATKLTIWDTTQAPIPIRNGLARWFGLEERQVDVVAPFIGGGFGPKIMMFYPEEILIPWIAMRLGRPAKWVEDRAENFLATTQERLQIHTAEMALSSEGRILGVRDDFLHDTGAYDTYGLTVPINSQCTLLGCYDVPAYHSEFRAVFTNRPLVTPVRGAGRQHGVFVMERLLDLAARQLGLDRVEIRALNYLAPDDFPHVHGIVYQDFSPLTYDSGNYEPALRRAAELIGEADAEPDSDGRRHGVGIVSYIEGTGIGPYEGARISVQPSGRVHLATGVGTQGQGHYTALAQIAAESLGCAVTDVSVVTGDTREFHWGTGTFASRGAVVAGNATHAAAVQVRDKAVRLAARQLEADIDQIELAAGVARVRAEPERSISLGELASLANPLRGAVRPGSEPGLEATAYFGPERGTTASGVHAMRVAVDTETYQVSIRDYVVVHDCGRVINPLILDGQIQGGVAQGVGNAFFEQLVFDDDGQLQNASFMDYLLPTATDMPRVRIDHIETPATDSPLGVKGAGEAGCIPTAAAFAQAIEDALGIDGLEILEMPLSPCRLFELVQEAGR